MNDLSDLTEGAVFEGPYPFTRSTYSEFDGEGYSDAPTWRPGVDHEPQPPYGEEVKSVADGVGAIILTVISVHKPGRYPTRVFYTRKWRRPDGKEFGKGGCRICTVEKFRRLARGYAHEYEIKPTAEKSAA